MAGGLNVGEALNEFIKLHKCMLNVIGNVVGESDLKPLYEEYRRDAEALIQHDLQKCLDVDDDDMP